MRNPLHPGDIFCFIYSKPPYYFYRVEDEFGTLRNLSTGGLTTLEIIIQYYRKDGDAKGPYLLTTSMDLSKYAFDV